MVGGLQVSETHTCSQTSILSCRRNRKFAPDVYTFPEYRENLLRGQLPKYGCYPGNLNRHSIRRYPQLIFVPSLDLLNGSQIPSVLPKLCEHPMVVG